MNLLYNVSLTTAQTQIMAAIYTHETLNSFALTTDTTATCMVNKIFIFLTSFLEVRPVVLFDNLLRPLPCL